MINININCKGFASGDAWARIVCDPNMIDTYTLHTDYPDKYKSDKYKVSYTFRDCDDTTDRMYLDDNDNVIIPVVFLDSNNKVYCKFIATLVEEDVDVLTSSFEVILTLQSSSYLNPDADKFIVVATRRMMYRLPSDFLANGKVVKVVYDDTNNQQSTFYYWDAISRMFVKEPNLNGNGSGSVTAEARIVYSQDEMLSLEDAKPGTFVYRKDLDTVMILKGSPASQLTNWTSVSFDIMTLPVTELIEGTDYLVVGKPDGQHRISLSNIEAAIGNWKLISNS